MLLLLLLLFILFASVHIRHRHASRKSTTNFTLALKPNTRIQNAENKNQESFYAVSSQYFFEIFISLSTACFDILCAETKKHVCSYWFKN